MSTALAIRFRAKVVSVRVAPEPWRSGLIEVKFESVGRDGPYLDAAIYVEEDEAERYTVGRVFESTLSWNEQTLDVVSAS